MKTRNTAFPWSFLLAFYLLCSELQGLPVRTAAATIVFAHLDKN